MRAKMAAGVVRVLLIYFVFLAYSDDFRPMDGLTLVLTTSASKISMDVSPMVFFLAILDVNLTWLDLTWL